jgi:hypothetical protein
VYVDELPEAEMVAELPIQILELVVAAVMVGCAMVFNVKFVEELQLFWLPVMVNMVVAEGVITITDPVTLPGSHV